jgi:hypothetical protein
MPLTISSSGPASSAAICDGSFRGKTPGETENALRPPLTWPAACVARTMSKWIVGSLRRACRIYGIYGPHLILIVVVSAMSGPGSINGPTSVEARCR